MAFIDYVLEPPTYGWQDKDGNLIKPTPNQIWKEFFKRINIFKTRKNWLGFMSWVWVFCLAPFFVLFCVKYFTIPLFIAGFIYSMILMGSHGTVWYHRYSTHRAFKFRNSFWRFITQHLVLKVVPEEAYVVSHHVHHAKSDQPGDPYNANCGFLYCFLADVNHQAIARNLTREDYEKAVALLKDTGVVCNSYEQYQRWGTIAHPARVLATWILNWSFWFGVFYLVGGMALVCALFGGACFWAVGVRTFNYEGHGKGKDKRQDGMDFNREDMSINQYWPGIVAGEWHNNHHAYPRSARSGFLPYQIDFAWYYVYLLHKIGGIESYNDNKKQFFEEYIKPYKDQKFKKQAEQLVEEL
jgi:stearoyl-CoA desaturase (delta-9 desaturase)